MYQKGKKRCVACNGSGWYDNCDKNGNPVPCGACNGTGCEIMDNTENKELHHAVLNLLFADILNSEQANKLHEKIDKKFKK